MAPARILFVVTQTFSLLIGLTGLGLAYISLFTSLNAFADFLPVEMIQATGVVSAFVLMVSVIGLTMVLCRLDECFSIFVVLSFLQLVFNICFFVVLVMFSRGLETLPGIDVLLNDTFTNFDAAVLEIALENEASYKTVQDQLECCGVNLESAFKLEVNDTMTGEECLKGDPNAVQVVTQIKDAAGTNDAIETLINLALQQAPFNDDGFFCEEALKKLKDTALSGLIIVFGFVIVFELLSLITSCLINHLVERGDDGKLDFDNATSFNKVIVKVTTSPFQSAQIVRRMSSERWRGPKGRVSSGSADEKLTVHDEEHINGANFSGSDDGGNPAQKSRMHSFNAGVLGLIAPFRSRKKLGGQIVLKDEPPIPPPKLSKNELDDSLEF